MEANTNENEVIRKEENGAIYKCKGMENILMQAPNIPYFRIPEEVNDIDEKAFRNCPLLEKADIPYHINDYSIDKALEQCDHYLKIEAWNWGYDDETIPGEELVKINAGVKDEHGFVYSQDGKMLLLAPNTFESYHIPEGVEHINRHAFKLCDFSHGTLHVPYTCSLKDKEPPFGNERVTGLVVEWDRSYADRELLTDTLYFDFDDRDVDEEHQVVYSKDGTHLLNCMGYFGEKEYTVRDGVTTICDTAFIFSEDFDDLFTLYIPRSVRVIGSDIFLGAYGRIIVLP